MALNPDGELLLGFKPEDRAALKVDPTKAVPGNGMVEWGPGPHVDVLRGAPDPQR
ncbi:MAG: hypothetical protein Ct9H300mP25_15930 [Acidobacteriota bacterium]|nr:MAG: hypothetical protein Ct9H300mP25_15930 [Acidobacteriota bacterium]